MHVSEHGERITKPKASNKTTKIIVPKLRVRSAPNFSAEIIGFVYQGEIYKVTKEHKGWYKINTKHNKTGWIYNKYTREAVLGESETQKKKEGTPSTTTLFSNNQTKAEKQELAERIQILETLLAQLITLIQKFISSN